MGRKKVEMKLIENKSSRQVTFSKRRNGLMKKAKEISVLCDVEVALVIFSSRGKLYEFCSGGSLAMLLQRYKSRYDTKGEACTGVHESESMDTRIKTIKELLQTVERSFAGSNVEQLSVNDLIQLEKELGAALTQTKSRKTQLMMNSIQVLHEKEMMLREENKLLQAEIVAMEENCGRNGLVMKLDNNENQNTGLPQQTTWHFRTE